MKNEIKKYGQWVQQADGDCSSKGFAVRVAEVMGARSFGERWLFIVRMVETPEV